MPPARAMSPGWTAREELASQAKMRHAARRCAVSSTTAGLINLHFEDGMSVWTRH